MVEQVSMLFPMLEKILNYGLAVVCTLFLLFGIGWHFVKLKPVMEAQNLIISNNTVATTALSEQMKANTLILEKVSDKLIAHDERSIALHNNTVSVLDGINAIKISMPSKESLNRIHERLDSVADKNDVVLIHKRLDDIQDNLQVNGSQLNKITGKVGC